MLFALENDQEFLDLQVEMVRLQNSIRKTGKRLLIIFEGETPPAGSTIMRFVRFLNPATTGLALAKPTEQEAGQWYFQRYIKELQIRDRSFFSIEAGTTGRLLNR